MFLKKYQIKVVTEIKDFYRKARETKDKLAPTIQNMPPEKRHLLNWVQDTFDGSGKEYKDRCNNGLGAYYPRIVMKVPTGGGKTLLAVEAIREYHDLFVRRRTGLIVWIVPSETIYSQTVAKIRDKANPLRHLLDQASGNRTLIVEKGQRLTAQDIGENLVILFVMIQSLSRQNGKEALKVFQDSGGFEGFFPGEHRTDLHAGLRAACPNLDVLSEIGPIVKTSLGNAIRLSQPFIIIDEIHKVFSDMARKTIDGLNPEMVLGLSATPKAEMNVLVKITGSELKDEEMVKLDMHIIPPSGRKKDDWKSMLREIKAHRDALEKKAVKYKQSKGLYIRPIALIQVEATGKDQRGKGRVHSLDAKDLLQELGISEDEIAIKTSAQNDIEDVDLFARDCNVRYLITKEALREGWDCSFAYILGIIPNVNSDSGLTQLVGRILRQPYARKTGVKELDESYVYYSKGDTRGILEKVEKGFKDEGLEDLISKVKVSDNESINQTQTAKIRPEYRRKYGNAFFLPVWVMMDNGKEKRRFSYEMDIKPFIDMSGRHISDEEIERLEAALSDETKERMTITVTLDKDSRIAKSVDRLHVNGLSEISLDYLTRRYTELMENPFRARKAASAHLETVAGKLGKQKTAEHFGFIAAFLFNLLAEEKKNLEESLFLKCLKQNKLVLAVSDDIEEPDSIGYRVPQEDTVTVTREPNPYKNYLYEYVDLLTMNSLEKKVGDTLDKQEKILWWFRNRATRNWYSIQGWREYKIRPDFVAAVKKKNGGIEITYIIESKGEHLLGNDDTTYKKKVLDVMTERNEKKEIKRYTQPELPFGEVNTSVSFQLIEGGKEEEEIRKLFK